MEKTASKKVQFIFFSIALIGLTGFFGSLIYLILIFLGLKSFELNLLFFFFFLFILSIILYRIYIDKYGEIMENTISKRKERWEESKKQEDNEWGKT